MTALMGRTLDLKVSGEVLLNGAPHPLLVNSSLSPAVSCDEYRSMCAVVPQFDNHLKGLNVFETVEYSARIRLQHQFSKEEIAQLVEAILTLLNLHRVQGNSVENLSGGQRRLLTLASELVALPQLMFIDELTSGLDSSTALETCKILARICAATGSTCLMIIHQPRKEIFEEGFDDLILLGYGGAICFHGPAKSISDYFSREFNLKFGADENPSDLLMDALKKNYTKFAERWEKINKSDMKTTVRILSAERENLPVSMEDSVRLSTLQSPLLASSHEPNKRSPSRSLSFSQHFSSLCLEIYLSHRRHLIQQVSLNGLKSLVVEIGVCIACGLVMGISSDAQYTGIYTGPYSVISPAPNEGLVPQLATFIAMGASMASAASGTAVFGEERENFYSESSRGFNRLAYFIGVNMATIYRNMISALHFAVVYHLVAMPIIEFTELLRLSFLVFFITYGICFMISMVASRVSAPLVATVICLIYSVFNGYVPQIPAVLKLSCPFFYVSEVFYTFSTAPFIQVMQVEKVSAPIFGYSIHSVDRDIWILVAFGVIYRIIAGFGLLLINRKRQL